MSQTDNRKKQVAVGVFIFLGIAILMIGVLTIGSQRKAFVKSIPVRVIFEDVQGLQNGNNIWLSGMKVGTVKKVEFYGTSQVEVILNIEKAAAPHIRKDAMAKVSTDGLVGNKIVVIYGGTDEAPPIAANDLLKTQHHIGTDEMLATLQANNSNLLEVTGNLRTISKKLTTNDGTLGQLINDPTMGNNLQASLKNLQTASANSQLVVANLRDFTAGLHRPGGLANELVTDTTVFSNLRGTMTRFNDAATAAAEFTQKIKATGDRLSDGLNDTNTPVGVLLHDQEMAADLQRTIKNLRVSSKELSDDLEAVQHNFLLRGFFRKKEKNKTD